MKTVALGLCCLLAACGSDLPSGGGDADLRGDWDYFATQSAPQADFRGSLVITGQNGNAFSGNIEYQETDAQGTVRNRAGVVSGRLIASDAIDFDAFIDEDPRRHVGRIDADSVAGTWVGPGQVPTSGSFLIRRARP